MRVLVTGGAGFLGQHFVRHHLARGDEVLVIDNLSAAAKPEFEFFHIEAGEYFSSAAVDFDLAYHFAAPVGGRMKIEHDPLFNADSLRLDSQFFRWAINHAKVAVYPSSSAVYGAALQRGKGMALAEDLFHPAQERWYAPDQMYGFTKMVGENLAWRAKDYGLKTLCVRPFSGYGPGQSLDYPAPAICQRALEQQDPLLIWGSGAQARDFIHVSDVVGATSARLAAGLGSGYETMNIGWGSPVTFHEVAVEAARLRGYQPTITSDLNRPEGVHSRYCDPTVMLAYYTPTIDLRSGLGHLMESLSAQGSNTGPSTG